MNELCREFYEHPLGKWNGGRLTAGGAAEQLTVDADDFDHCDGEEGQRRHVHLDEDGRHQEDDQDGHHASEDS